MVSVPARRQRIAAPNANTPPITSPAVTGNLISHPTRCNPNRIITAPATGPISDLCCSKNWPTTLAAAPKLMDADPRKHRDVSRHQRQHTGRKERNNPCHKRVKNRNLHQTNGLPRSTCQVYIIPHQIRRLGMAEDSACVTFFLRWLSARRFFLVPNSLCNRL